MARDIELLHENNQTQITDPWLTVCLFDAILESDVTVEIPVKAKSVNVFSFALFWKLTPVLSRASFLRFQIIQVP